MSRDCRWPVPLLLGLFHAPLFAQVITWNEPANTGPTARAGHALVYDSQRGNTVMFGGYPYSGNNGETWQWNGSAWTQVAYTGPLIRTGHAMAYDSLRGRTVLFGGMDSGGNTLGDAWEWDGTAWTQALVTGPYAVRGHAMAYDSQRGKTVLSGGYDSNGNLGFTWEWDGSSWTLAGTGPRRVFHAMAYDSQRGRTVLFGGSDGGPGNATVYADTLEWDGSSWTVVATSGPAGRFNHAMAYDSQRGRSVLFGGFDNGPVFFSDTWEWDGSTWTQLGTSVWPTPRSLTAMAYDSQRGRTVMFAGRADTWPLASYLGDTWELGNSSSPPNSTATPYGSGCGSPALSLSPVANGRPVINTSAQLSLSSIPSTIAFVALGWSNAMIGPFALPFSLAGYGMAGCDLLQSAEFATMQTTPTGPGAASFSLAIPNLPVLVGLHVYLQGWAPAPGANAGDTIVSNGIDWGIGNS